MLETTPTLVTPTRGRKETTMWDSVTGLVFCRDLERRLFGTWHVSLGGSVMSRGWSDTDLDVVVSPHDGPTPPDVQPIRDAMYLMYYRRRPPENCGVKTRRQTWHETWHETYGRSEKIRLVSLIIFPGSSAATPPLRKGV
jgi:hypothetical protein